MSKATKEALAYALAEDAHDGQKYGEHDYFEYHVLGVGSKFVRSCSYGRLISLEDYISPNTKCNKCGTAITLDGECKSYDHEAYVTALLHDVVEDSDVNEDLIRQLFGIKISNAVLYITNHFGSGRSYLDEYISMVNRNPLSRKVKIADLKFNLSQPDTKPSLVKRYTEALSVLEAKND